MLNALHACVHVCVHVHGPDAYAFWHAQANYTLAYLENAKTVHNLTIDYIGQWNERNAPADYDAALRRAVSSSR